MQIDLNKLREEGFEVHFDNKEQKLDIYPTTLSEGLRKNFDALMNEMGLDIAYRVDVIETIHEYQVLSGIRRSRNIGY